MNIDVSKQARNSWTGSIDRLGALLDVFWRHGQYRLWLFSAVVGPLVYIITRASMLLDHVFYPKLNRTEVRKPVFIVGHPRSGTTFFQKRLYESGKVSMFTTWDIAMPSISLRTFLEPVISLFRVLKMGVLLSASGGHEIRIDGVEEDEGMFLHYLDTEVITHYCPWLLTDPRYRSRGLKMGWNDEANDKRTLLFFRQTLRRQILHTGNTQVVAKLNASVFRIKTILEVFPDARIIYMVRPPADTIKSFFNFTYNLVGESLGPKELPRFFARKYEWSKRLYSYFEEVRDEIPEDRLAIVKFNDLTEDLPATMQKAWDFIGIDPGPAYRQAIQDRSQRSHEKRHTNSAVEGFGVSPQRIKADLSFVYEKYFSSGINEAAAG